MLLLLFKNMSLLQQLTINTITEYKAYNPFCCSLEKQKEDECTRKQWWWVGSTFSILVSCQCKNHSDYKKYCVFSLCPIELASWQAVKLMGENKKIIFGGIVYRNQNRLPGLLNETKSDLSSACYGAVEISRRHTLAITSSRVFEI